LNSLRRRAAVRPIFAEKVRQAYQIQESRMQIQVNTDDNVEGRDDLTRQVEAEIRKTLGRFSEQVTRVEVHLSDENAGRSGAADKRCLLEARLEGRQPEAVSHTAGSLPEAFAGAAQKMKRLLDGTLGRLGDRNGRRTIRGDGGF
jgi:hypothetical protein